MKLLVLGGTLFVGRHLVDAALAQGHEVTLFHRGKRGADLFAQAEHLHGDRDGGLAPLEGRRWDVVVDTSGYVPRLVGDSARLLANAVDHYVFVSSISVYADPRHAMRETTPLAALADPTVEAVTWETYGGLKVLCERALEAAMPGRALMVRPGIVVGPYDTSDRFTYWLARMARGGEVLAPDTPDRPVQFIDARDLADWMLEAARTRLTGAYNAVGPAQPLPLADFLAEADAVTEARSRVVWADTAWLEAQQALSSENFPLWVPEEALGFAQADASRAIAHGLRFRPLAETMRDTLAWHRTRPVGTALKAGLAPEEEARLLAAWHAHCQAIER
ncbi:MAG TPA: NAD-dependent epimerase/dehydratase family protein [Oscillatoriaceae cyanobacterium]